MLLGKNHHLLSPSTFSQKGLAPVQLQLQISMGTMTSIFCRHPQMTTPSVAAGDVDGDDKIDVLSASYTYGNIRWYKNNGIDAEGEGGIAFAVNDIYSGATGARSVAAADIDGNGVLDVFSASTEDNSIRWFENKNEEGFMDYTIFAYAQGAYSVTTADIDGDNDIDLVSASSADNTIRWYENKGIDGFTCIDVIFRNAESASSVTTADMDGDMDIDVLSASYSDGTIKWYENKGVEGFAAYNIDENAPGANTIAAADFNNDGNMDVVAGIFNAAEIRWYENNKEALNMQRVLPQSIALHPNPMTNVLNISYISTTTVTYTLYDSTGKQLSSQTHTGKEHQLEVSHLASGTYLLKANNDTQFKYYRFVKE